MLHHLIEYAHSHLADTEPGFSRETIHWAICCTAAGQFLEVIRLGDTSKKKNPGRLFSKVPKLVQGELVGGAEPRSQFLFESLQTVALFLKEGEEPSAAKKAEAKHRAFVGLLRDAAAVVPLLGGAAALLDDAAQLEKLRLRLVEQKAAPTEKTTLQIDGQFPIDFDAWHAWWRSYRAGLGAGKSTARAALCFATGNACEPAPTHPPVKGLASVGGQGTGDKLVCCDKEAFSSYGFVQSANAAVSPEAATMYSEALNDLLRERGRRLAGALVVHWFKRAVPPTDDPLAWLEEALGDDIELQATRRADALLRSIRSGERQDLAGNEYYAMTLSGMAGRVMVRDWMEGTFEDLAINVSAWFDDLAIVAPDGSLAIPPTFSAIVKGLTPDWENAKPPPAPLIAQLWTAAVRRTAVPAHALALVWARVRVAAVGQQTDKVATRMGVIKAFHIRKFRGGIPMRPFLNEEHPDPAYQCGRLLAVLARLQHAAMPKVDANIVQRFYGAASSTPALVFGRLIRTSQAHLGKLEGGLAHWYEQRIAAIIGQIGDRLPRTLDLERQSLFALGYYQQLADRSKTTKDDDATDGAVETEE